MGFEPKTNIRDTNSSSSDGEEEGAEYKVKRISNSSASAVQKQSVADVLQNSCHAWNFIKKRLQHRCFPTKFTKSLRTPFLQNTFTLMALSRSKQCKLIKTYPESLSFWKKKWYTWTVLLRLVFLDNEHSSEVFQTLLAVSHFGKIARKSQKQSSRGVL